MSKIYNKVRDLTMEKNGLSEHDASLILDTIDSLKKYNISEEQLLNNIENIKFHYRSDTFSEDRQKDIVEFVKNDFSFGLSPEVEVNYRGDAGWQKDCSKTKGIVNVLSVRKSHTEEGVFNDKNYYTLGIDGTRRYRGFGNVIATELTKECLEEHGRKFSFDFLRESCMSPYREVLMNYDKEYLVKNFFDMDSDFFKKETNINLDKGLHELEVKINQAIFDRNTFKSIEDIPAAMDRAKTETEFNWMSYVVDYVPTVNKAMCEYFAEKQHLYSDERYVQLKEELSDLPFFDKENLKILDNAREVNKVREGDRNIVFEVTKYDYSQLVGLDNILPSVDKIKNDSFEKYRQLLSEKNEKGFTAFDEAIRTAYLTENYNIKYLSDIIDKVKSDDFTSGNIEFKKQAILMDMLDNYGKLGIKYSENMISVFKDNGFCEKTLMEEIVDRNISDVRFLNNIQEDNLHIESKNGNVLNYVSQQENINYQLMNYFIDKGVDVTSINEQGRNALHNILENNRAIELKNFEIEENKSFFKKGPEQIEIDSFSQTRIVQKLIDNGLDVNLKDPISGLKPLDFAVGINLDEKITPNRDMIDLLVKNGADIKNCLGTVLENKDFDTLKIFINHGHKLEDMLKINLEASSDFNDKDINKLMKYEEKVVGIKNKENLTSYERDEFIKKGLDKEDGVNWERNKEAKEDAYFGH